MNQVWRKNQPRREIVRQSLGIAESLAAAYRQAITEAAIDSPLPHEIYNELAQLQHEFEPLLANSIYESELLAWLDSFGSNYHRLPEWFRDKLAESNLGGFDRMPPAGTSLVSSLMPDEPGPRFPIIENAAKSLMKRRILERDQFDMLSSQARSSAFTIADGLTSDAIDEVRSILVESITEGPSLPDFQNRLKDSIASGVMSPAKVELVYRQAIQSSYRDGRESLFQNPVVSEVFPYQEYLPIRDGRVRDEHLALEKLGIEGTGIYRRTDPMWDYFTPPWDYNCRCGVNPLTIEQAARRGLKEAQVWLSTGREPHVVSRLDAIPFRPRSGFGSRQGVLVA